MANKDNVSDLAKIDELEIATLSDEELEAVAGGSDVPVDQPVTTHSSCSCSCCASGATF